MLLNIWNCKNKDISLYILLIFTIQQISIMKLINFQADNHTELIAQLKKDYPQLSHIDSAHLEIAHQFQQLATVEGGDDDLAGDDIDDFCIFGMEKLTSQDIENWDNSDESTEGDLYLELYQRIKLDWFEYKEDELEEAELFDELDDDFGPQSPDYCLEG